MADETKVTDNIPFDYELGNQVPDNSWVSKPVPESVTEAIDNAPIGALYEISYAVLAQRLRSVLSSDNLGLISSIVHDSINFRSLNPNFYAGGGRVPTVPPNSGAGAGDYQSSIWGVNKDERLPQTLPLENEVQPYAAGQDPGQRQNAGLLIAKLFADLEHHLPTVLFNITAKQNIPIGLAGSAVSRRFYRDGHVVSELGYRAILSIEATAITADDNSTASLQGIIEAAFGVLRDSIGSGPVIHGQKYQLALPTNLTPSPITEVDAPWSQGDEKGAKLYVATVGLENMMFEAYVHIAKPMSLAIDPDAALDPANQGEPRITLAVGDTDPSEPMRLVLGKVQQIRVSGAPLTSDLGVSQTKRVVQIRKPYHGTGVYEIVPRRTGEAELRLYDSNFSISETDGSSSPAGYANSPLARRKVVVVAC